MDRLINAHFARAQFGQIMDRVNGHRERFVVDRRGKPSVVIMSGEDFISTVAPPRIGCKRLAPAPGRVGSMR